MGGVCESGGKRLDIQTYSDRYTLGHGNQHRDSYCNVHPHADRDGNSDGDGNSYRNGDRYRNSNGDRYSDRDSDQVPWSAGRSKLICGR